MKTGYRARKQVLGYSIRMQRIEALRAIIAKDLISEENGATPYYCDGKLVEDLTTCGNCGMTWNDALISQRTPAPSGRCPYGAIHKEIAELKRLTKGKM